MTASENKKTILKWLPAFLWAGLIFYLSSLSGVHLPGGDFLFKDKVAHTIAYGVFCVLVLYGCGSFEEIGLAGGIGLLAVITYGFLDEIHQKFVPGRLCDPFDFLADSAGAVGSFALVVLRSGYRKKKEDEIPVTEGNPRHTA